MLETSELLWTEESDQKSAGGIADRLVRELMSDTPFCLWLLGDLGAGKTFMVGLALKRLGLASHIPVSSPTYTYCNEYQIHGQWFAHVDLYRASGIDLEDMGLIDARPYRGTFVEWPEQLPSHPSTMPTLILRISDTEGGFSRRYDCLRPKPKAAPLR